MKGRDDGQLGMFSYVRAEERLSASHPLRRIRELALSILKDLEPEFDGMYSKTGRPSIPPERLLMGLLLMALYSIRSERQLMDRIEFDLLFRWFLGMDPDEKAWDATVFSKNRERLLEHEVAALFFAGVVERAQGKGLLSSDHFSVDGTQLAAWSSLKSFRPKDGSGGDGSNYHGQKRRNDTHESTSEPESMLYRKGYGKEAILSYLGHSLMENRNGFIVDVCVTRATGTAEREAALELLERNVGRGSTVGADKGYDVESFVTGVRELGITPHVARKEKYSAIDGRTTRHAGYKISQKKRKRIEQPFGWMKTVGGLRRLRLKGLAKVEWLFQFAAAAYNLVRLAKLCPNAA